MTTRYEEIDARLKAREATMKFHGAAIDWRPRDKDGNLIDTTGWTREETTSDAGIREMFDKMIRSGDFSPIVTGILPK